MDKQYFIRIHSFNEKDERITTLVPVTENEFSNYYREIDSFRKKQQRHGGCVCPANKRLDCDMDCFNCQFHKSDVFSLDDKLPEDDDLTWMDFTPNGEMPINEVVEDSQELHALFLRLEEMMPEAIEIGRLRMNGDSDVHISKRIGIPNTTLRYRLQKVKKIIEKEFPDFF